MLSSISSTLTSGWNVLETLVTDKPPAGEKDWCAGGGACVRTVARAQRH